MLFWWFSVGGEHLGLVVGLEDCLTWLFGFSLMEILLI